MDYLSIANAMILIGFIGLMLINLSVEEVEQPVEYVPPFTCDVDDTFESAAELSLDIFFYQMSNMYGFNWEMDYDFAA